MALVTSEAEAPLCIETIAGLLSQGASLDILDSAVQMLHDRLGDTAEAVRIKLAFASMLATDSKRTQAGCTSNDP